MMNERCNDVIICVDCAIASVVEVLLFVLSAASVIILAVHHTDRRTTHHISFTFELKVVTNFYNPNPKEP